MIIERAGGADAGAGEGGRSEGEGLVGRARQGEAGGGVVEALGPGPFGVGLGEVEVKEVGGAMVLGLAGLFTPPSGHVLNWKEEGRKEA